ncbi:hypothetical protein PZ938_07820 [Luteipulveratus sp. YIM 133132]|uniref:hypothetical protein n=1 Tax=Luteipulveratus flavus TaxID=3031728 RepID=UPI0023AED399|nr:hypothetical protein [Luteipulveratus sp. YIM 133132]MDE9365510.1 hypothetical protein [Luteipulveratus sp. YIM 133132]
MTDQPGRPRRPAFRPPAEMDIEGESPDPAQVSEVAHETAAVLVGAGRATQDPQVRTRLIHLVDELGLSTVAELWAARPATSLPGALWRLYTLREWVHRDPVGAAADYDAGMRHADVAHAVAGAADPFGPEEIKALGDEILRGVFEGDLAVALERAAAFCRVISIGRAHRADDQDGHDEPGAQAATRTASALLGTAADLQRSASLWRAGTLD